MCVCLFRSVCFNVLEGLFIFSCVGVCGIMCCHMQSVLLWICMCEYVSFFHKILAHDHKIKGQATLVDMNFFLICLAAAE